MHKLESVVDLRKGHSMGDKSVKIDFARHGFCDETWQLRAALSATKSSATPLFSDDLRWYRFILLIKDKKNKKKK